MHRIVRLVVLLSSLAATACGQSSRSEPPASQAGSAPGIPSLPRAHGFELAPSLVRVCSQSVTGGPSGHIQWDLYASNEEPSALLAFYRDEMREVTPQEESGSWMWRIPNAERPEHVMHLYAPGRAEMPSCGTDPPPTARSLVNLSTLSR